MDTPIITSRLLTGLGVPHAFTTRTGGVSAGMFASLNFGNPSEIPPDQRDPRTNIDENWRRLLHAVNAPGRRVEQVHQVHGAAVHVVSSDDADESAGAPTGTRPEGRPVPKPDPKADAIVTRNPRVLAAVRVADCAPVLLASGDGRVVAAVHAGWRGVIAGVLAAALRQMRQLAIQDTGIVAAIGPCIGGGAGDGSGAFEVGPEVVAEFREVFGDRTSIVRQRSDGKGLVNLQAALRMQAEAAGARTVEVVDRCTFAEPDAFFSHRRDRGLTGRMVGLVGPRTAT